MGLWGPVSSAVDSGAPWAQGQLQFGHVWAQRMRVALGRTLRTSTLDFATPQRDRGVLKNVKVLGAFLRAPIQRSLLFIPSPPFFAAGYPGNSCTGQTSVFYVFFSYVVAFKRWLILLSHRFAISSPTWPTRLEPIKVGRSVLTCTCLHRQ